MSSRGLATDRRGIPKKSRGRRRWSHSPGCYEAPTLKNTVEHRLRPRQTASVLTAVLETRRRTVRGQLRKLTIPSASANGTLRLGPARDNSVRTTHTPKRVPRRIPTLSSRSDRPSRKRRMSRNSRRNELLSKDVLLHQFVRSHGLVVWNF